MLGGTPVAPESPNAVRARADLLLALRARVPPAQLRLHDLQHAEGGIALAPTVVQHEVAVVQELYGEMEDEISSILIFVSNNM